MTDGRIPAADRFKHPIGPEVHRLLWEEWDPIGVRGMGDWPDDEYDGYVWPIISKVMQVEPAETVAEYLNWVQFQHMGLSDLDEARERNLDLAQRLVALKPEASH